MNPGCLSLRHYTKEVVGEVGAEWKDALAEEAAWMVGLCTRLL